MKEETKHVCEHCGKEFKTSQGLGGHKKTFHSIGLDELNGVLKGEPSPDESSNDLKGYRNSLEQVRKKVESSEEYDDLKGLILAMAIVITLIIFMAKLNIGSDLSDLIKQR